jgi:hypothetical protein
MTFATFQAAMDQKTFRKDLQPLRSLLEHVTPEDECRWKRLQRAIDELERLELTCRSLLENSH